MEYAGFWQRLGGSILDSLLYSLVLAVFTVPAIVLGVGAFDGCETIDGPDTTEIVCPPGEPDGAMIAGAIGLGAVGVILVAVLYLRALGRTGQTWGRRIVGVKVVRTRTGEAPGIGRALGRTLFANVISAQVCYLGYLWMLWDGQKQTWHDKVCDTHVVKA
ncbi:MAG: RDD family protein [Actinomycetes bacterium]|jgi:uncharacterized RDD family membrane protein YckC|uniref:Unannotated protein n=1 Tax=freshwater metagenome TaxID=449393 RepID=A0A6J6FQB9_9ZZZZ|nr:hypothetical protein [Actinomycetota bacterium]